MKDKIESLVVEAFNGVIFNTYKDDDDNYYILRCQYIEETNNGYIYKIGRRPTLSESRFADHTEQFIMVKLSRRPTENDLPSIWKEAVKR